MEIEVTSWADLQEKLFHDTWNEKIHRYRSQYAYRGQSSVAYDLQTSLMRLGGNYAELERHIIRNFKKYSYKDIIDDDTIWHWLSIAQHHGLPTRLLDWTFSPYIALHFATSNTELYDEDAVIWSVNYSSVHAELPAAFRLVNHKEGSDIFTAQMLASVTSSLSDFDQLSDDIVVFFEPPSMDARIVNQHALFSVMNNPARTIDSWLKGKPELRWFKIIIPARIKWEIRDKLDQANITERVLFPGLTGLCSWLKRQYSPAIKNNG
ncbi:MAG: FRG domain-containing protein [Cyclobacteriaceae bacterium]|nr:FRG domain-containing protein [Cyclobacteriaceae bacterium]